MEELIIKSNRLINAREKKALSALEQKVLLQCIVKCSEQDFEKEIPFIIQDIFEGTIVGTQQYNAFRKACSELSTSAVSFEEFENGEWARGEYLPIFSKIKADKRSGNAVFQFNKQIKDHIIGLRSNFTTYSYQNVQHLDSGFSIRIYELLMQGKNKYRSRAFTIENLLDTLSVSQMKTYKVFSKIKTNILNKACTEITEKTDINCLWEVSAKEGRKITEITFVWEYKNPITAIETTIPEETKEKIVKKPSPSKRKARLVVDMDDYILNRDYYLQKEDEFDVQIENDEGDLVPRALFDAQFQQTETIEEKPKKQAKTKFLKLDLEGKTEEEQDKMQRLLQRLTEDLKLSEQEAIAFVNHTQAKAETGVWKFVNQTKTKIREGEVKNPKAYTLKCIKAYHQTGVFN